MKDTITSKQQIERLFREGRRSSSSMMTVICLPSNSSDSRGLCMYVAGKKLGSAPFRNRCKRVMRHAAYELGAPWRGYDVVFVARRNVAHAPHAKVLGQMKRGLTNLGVMDNGR